MDEMDGWMILCLLVHSKASARYFDLLGCSRKDVPPPFYVTVCRPDPSAHRQREQPKRIKLSFPTQITKLRDKCQVALFGAGVDKGREEVKRGRIR